MKYTHEIITDRESDVNCIHNFKKGTKVKLWDDERTRTSLALIGIYDNINGFFVAEDEDEFQFVKETDIKKIS